MFQLKINSPLIFKTVTKNFGTIASGFPLGYFCIVKITNSQYTPIQASHSQFTGSEPRTPMFSRGKIIENLHTKILQILFKGSIYVHIMLYNEIIQKYANTFWANIDFICKIL